jgi:DNA-binding response OmpR family regulator
VWPPLTPTGSRMASPPAEQASPLIVGGVTLDVVGRLAITPRGVMRLTKIQTELLAHLMRRRGQACSRAELMSEVWGYSEVLESRTVDVHVAALREKLRRYGPRDGLRINTVRGVGYGIDVDGSA